VTPRTPLIRVILHELKGKDEKPDAFASTLYADDILLFKPISSPEDHKNLQKDIDAISRCTSAWHLTLNSSKCKYLIAPRKRQPHLPPGGLLLGDCILEQVQSYHYLGF